jgi:DinB superfamily
MSDDNSWCDCGFGDHSVATELIGERVVAGVRDVITLIGTATGQLATTQPSPGRWSALEYAAHVRDVLLTIRDRLVIGLVEDQPGFKPMYRDHRVHLGLYHADTVENVVPELLASATMFQRLFSAIDPALHDRIVLYGFPSPDPRSLLWMGRQAVHEIDHHLNDIRENFRLLSAR